MFEYKSACVWEMSTDIRNQFEQRAADEKQAAAPPQKAEPTGVKALLKQHNDKINPPPPKVSWSANDDAGQTGRSEFSHVKYEKKGGKPTGPPPKKSITDLP